MVLRFTASFENDYKGLPDKIQKCLDKQLIFLVKNSKHPSLRTKKIKGHPYVWEGRITKNYRFTFQIMENIYIMRRAGTHDILKNP